MSVDWIMAKQKKKSREEKKQEISSFITENCNTLVKFPIGFLLMIYITILLTMLNFYGYILYLIGDSIVVIFLISFYHYLEKYDYQVIKYLENTDDGTEISMKIEKWYRFAVPIKKISFFAGIVVLFAVIAYLIYTLIFFSFLTFFFVFFFITLICGVFSFFCFYYNIVGWNLGHWVDKRKEDGISRIKDEINYTSVLSENKENIGASISNLESDCEDLFRIYHFDFSKSIKKLLKEKRKIAFELDEFKDFMKYYHYLKTKAELLKIDNSKTQDQEGTVNSTRDEHQKRIERIIAILPNIKEEIVKEEKEIKFNINANRKKIEIVIGIIFSTFYAILPILLNIYLGK